MKTMTFDEKKWKLVPIEPTPEMLKAGAIQDWVGEVEGRAGLSLVRDAYLDDWPGAPEGFRNIGIWAAMLEVAPEPAQEADHG